MKYLVLSALVCFFVVSCKKGDGNTAPEISFKSITPIFSVNALAGQPNSVAILTINIKDAEGDIGFTDGKDTSYVYVKNVTVPPFKIDSFKFPSNLSNVTTKNFKAEVEVNLIANGQSILYNYTPLRPGIKRDTIFFEVFVKDFGKNKSNIIRTNDPLYRVSL